MFDILFSFINLFTPIFIGVGVSLGVFVGIYLSKPKKNQVWKVMPNDYRGIDLNVREENAMSLHCEPMKGMPPQRFLKYRGGYTVVQKLRRRIIKITRHIAREGTAYTQRIESGILSNINLADTIKTLWGDTFYDSIPEEQILVLEDSKINVTVQLEDDPLTPESLPVISEENIKTEEDRQASATFWRAKKDFLKSANMEKIAFMGAGIGICFALSLIMGWIQLAPTP